MSKINDKEVITFTLLIIADILDIKRQVTYEDATRKYLKKRVAELYSMENLSIANTKSLYNLVVNVFYAYSKYDPNKSDEYTKQVAALGDIKDQLLDRLDLKETIEVEEV